MRKDFDCRFPVVMLVVIVLFVAAVTIAVINAHPPNHDPNVEHIKPVQSFSSGD